MKKITLILLAFINLSCSEIISKVDPVALSLKNNLMAFYTFSGNADDVSGNSNDGKLINISLVKDRFGKVNSAVNFSEINGCKISTNNFVVTGNKSRTISLWYRYTSNFYNHTSILNYGGDPNLKQQDFGIFISTLGGSGMPYIGAMISNPNGSYVGNYFSKIKDGKWHHYAFTYDNSTGKTLDKVKIYIDGALVQNDVMYSNANAWYFGNSNIIMNGPQLDEINTDSKMPLVFGQHSSNDGKNPGDFRSFTGDLDDVGFWGRSLNQMEISYLFNNEYKP